MSIKELTENRYLTFYACVSCVVILPLYIHWLPPFMILWGVFWFFENRNEFRTIPVKGNNQAFLFFLFLALFLWQTGELALADSIDSGFERIFKRLSFLLFPLVLFYPGSKIKQNIELILKIFVVSILVYLVYCFGNALHSSLVYKDGRWIFNAYHELYTYESFFMGARLSSIVHPSYLSMYVLMAVLISFESVFNSDLSVYKRYLWFVAGIFLILVIYLLSSRAGVMAGIIVLGLYFSLKFYQRLSKVLIVIVFVTAGAGSVIMLKTNERLKYSIDELSSSGIHGTFSKDTRYLIWKSAFGVIKSNILLGVGTGDASEELKKEFKDRGYVDGYYDNLNAHNQFLEILLENGIIGLIIFLSIIGYLVFLSILDHNLILGLFIVMMIVFFMFETVLNRLAGITFFPLFTFLLSYSKLNKSK